MKQIRIIVTISALTISLLIGLGLQTKAQVMVGNLKVKIDPKQKSVIITKQKMKVIEENCSSMCQLYFATTYQVKYSGYDGVIKPNETLITLEQTVKDGIPAFKLPGYKNDIVGVVLGSSGASGGSVQSLYLIDIISGKKIIITTTDQLNPKWFMMFGLVGYLEKTYSYFQMSNNIKLKNIYLIDTNKFQVVNMYKTRVFWLLIIVSLFIIIALFMIILRKRK